MRFRRRPLFLFSVAAFNTCKNIASIVLAVPRDRIAYARRAVKRARMHKVTTIVAGGARRQDSVRNALLAVAGTRGIVAIHDAVRPCVGVPLINKGLRLCRRYRAVVFGVPVSDTMKLVKNTVIRRTVPRDDMYMVQTPQFFDITLLKRALEEAPDGVEFTDEAALLENAGIKVHLFAGDPANIKVTTRKDLALIDRIQ